MKQWATTSGGTALTTVRREAPVDRLVDEHLAEQGVEHRLANERIRTKVNESSPSKDVVPSRAQSEPAQLIANVPTHIRHYRSRTRCSRQIDLGAVALRAIPLNGRCRGDDQRALKPGLRADASRSASRSYATVAPQHISGIPQNLRRSGAARRRAPRLSANRPRPRYGARGGGMTPRSLGALEGTRLDRGCTDCRPSTVAANTTHATKGRG